MLTQPSGLTFGEAGADQTSAASYFRTFGFIVLRRFFDPLPLVEEFDRVMHDGPVSSFDVASGTQIRFQYVPVMTGETPTSLSLPHISDLNLSN
jgi:hypothetical protein